MAKFEVDHKDIKTVQKIERQTAFGTEVVHVGARMRGVQPKLDYPTEIKRAAKIKLNPNKIKKSGIIIDDMQEKLSQETITEFKAKVKDIMIKAGAQQSLIDEVLTDDEIIFGLNNNFTAEDVAWGLLF